MGDGIMALFGAPLAHEDHAVRACYAALRMQSTARQHAARVTQALGVAVRIRIGLNSGEVVVRSIGYVEVPLMALSSDRADDLLPLLVGGDPSLAALQPLVIGRTRGNSFFLEESVRTAGLANRGLPGGSLRVLRVAPPDVPRSLSAVDLAVLLAKPCVSPIGCSPAGRPAEPGRCRAPADPER